MNNKEKNILIGVLIGIIILLIGVCVYLVFFRKEELREVTNCKEEKVCEKCDEKPANCESYESSTLTYQDGMLKTHLDENDKQFVFNGKTIKLNLVYTNNGGEIYLNDKKVDTIEWSGELVLYITEKYILFSWPGTTCGEIIVGYINENGNYVGELLTSLTYKDDDDTFFGIYKENDKIIGYAVVNEPELCGSKQKIEFVYDKGKLTVKDVK